MRSLLLGVKVLGEDDLHLFSGLIQGLTFSATRLLKILKLSIYYFVHFSLHGSSSKIFRTIFPPLSLALPLCPRASPFFKNFPFRTFVSLRILDPPGEILKKRYPTLRSTDAEGRSTCSFPTRLGKLYMRGRVFLR